MFSDPSGLAWGSARALLHFYTGGKSTVTLKNIGHLSTVQGATKPLQDQWEKSVVNKAAATATGLACNSSTNTFYSDELDANS